MRRGVHDQPASRVAVAKAKAQAALDRRRSGTSASIQTGGDGQFSAPPEAVGPLYVFRERVAVRANPREVSQWIADHGLPDIQEEPILEEGTLSDVNLQLWVEYCELAPDEVAALRRRRPDICTRHHEPFDDSGLNPTRLVQRRCEQPHCPRCTLRRGGYRFSWVSSRWTPHMARHATWSRWQADDVGPDQRRQLCWHSAWPLGLGYGPEDPFVAGWRARARRTGTAGD